ncbi:MAG: hypothetical protein P4L91_14985 [Burkholderiaceae bacterium]|nr:hypothetical protein [Burkholderiaceae bacterium]
MRRARAGAPWRIWAALLTAISFVVLVSTSAMHHHATAVDDQDCPVCSVVTHKAAGPLPLALPTPVVVFLSYAPFLLSKPGVAHASPVSLPPSCGPPAPISTIC